MVSGIQRVRRRRGAGPAGRGELAAGPEPVEVLPPWRQPGQLDVHAVPQLRPGGHDPALHDPAEALVGGQLPLDSVRRWPSPPSPSSASGSVASRVHSTMPSGAGSPEATPRVNG